MSSSSFEEDLIKSWNMPDGEGEKLFKEMSEFKLTSSCEECLKEYPTIEEAEDCRCWIK